MAAFLPLFCLLTAASGEVPSWSKAELKELVAQANAVGRMPFGPPQDQALAQLGGQAFRIPPKSGEPIEPYAERAVRHRQPHHPTVAKGQWVKALTRQLYADVGQRCADLRRFERDPKDDQFLVGCARDFQAAAQDAEKGLTYVIEGLEGFVDPLPQAEGETPQPIGCLALVRRGVITIENMERITFEGDRPAPDAQRTKRGALRELYSAQQYFNATNQMVGMYQPQAKKNVGHLRVAIAGKAPALYLNELFRGAREAEMRTVHLLVMGSGAKLRELPLLLKAPPKPKKKPKKGAPPPPTPVEVRCADEQSMDVCARKIEEARKTGPVVFLVD
ncbi:MAG: hypothetical protein IPG45_34815 [Deltaproteobacteria bacterium]|nr:hypothetical protein [Deltaproteobacteria bacterium]